MRGVQRHAPGDLAEVGTRADSDESPLPLAHAAIEETVREIVQTERELPRFSAVGRDGGGRAETPGKARGPTERCGHEPRPGNGVWDRAMDGSIQRGKRWVMLCALPRCHEVGRPVIQDRRFVRESGGKQGVREEGLDRLATQADHQRAVSRRQTACSRGPAMATATTESNGPTHAPARPRGDGVGECSNARRDEAEYGGIGSLRGSPGGSRLQLADAARPVGPSRGGREDAIRTRQATARDGGTRPASGRRTKDARAPIAASATR